MSVITLEQVNGFLQKPNQVQTLVKKILILLRCIDDRYDETNFFQGDYAIPGGGIGLIADVIAGLEAVLKRALTEKEFEIVYLTVTEMIGVPTFHSASVHVTVDSPVCGCGYLVQTVEGNTNISSSSAALLKKKILGLLAEAYKPVTFAVDHTAKSIAVVKGYDLGINPDGKMYVYHVDVHTDILSSLINALCEEFGITDKEDAIKTTLSVAGERLQKVIENLGMKEAPRYLIKSLDDVTLIETATAA